MGPLANAGRLSELSGSPFRRNAPRKTPTNKDTMPMMAYRKLLDFNAIPRIFLFSMFSAGDGGRI
jgi:hypothetical protein